ncbi:protein kinase, ATP binding site-containing protein [Tanacetum coccineum]
MLATGNFSEENQILKQGDCVIYRGQLSEGWKNCMAAFRHYRGDGDEERKAFQNELNLISSLKHDNIIAFIGYCDEGVRNMVIVYEYPVNGSLYDHLKNDDKRNSLTWAQRLSICLGVARGLKYLHSGVSEHGRIIHLSVMESKILLNNNLNARISGFDFSATISVDQPDQQVYRPVTDIQTNMDPVYVATGLVKAESDVFSFGVLLFKMLTSMYALDLPAESTPTDLIELVQHYYDSGLDKFIDPAIKDQTGGRSFHMFNTIAYKCISLNLKDRPTMATIVQTFEEILYINDQGDASITTTRSHQSQKLEEFFIPLKEILLATCNFSEAFQIGGGGFGAVYKGQLSEHWQNHETAIKRLDKTGRQGKTEFRNELELIFKFHHENIIPFIGYCDEGNEMILICLGAAKGLGYLHTGLGEDNRVIHRDVKSGNILLDGNMEAKICDFGLSKSKLTSNQQHSKLYTNAAGTNFYIDPVYHECGVLYKESDVYSFGVVLFEMVSGILAYKRISFDDGKPQPLIHLVRRYYNKELEKLVDPDIRDQVKGRSLHILADIAYRCLSFSTKERPSMSKIIKSIENALHIQDRGDASITTIQSHQYRRPEDLLIPLEEIKAACDFSITSRIGDGGFATVYKGRLSEHWHDHEVAIKRHRKASYQEKNEFRNELELNCRFYHENIIHFVGYCDEGNEMILVYEYANNGSLDYLLEDKNKRRCLTWVERLKICLGAAKGLDYLHTGLGEDNKVIHRDFKSGNILLDDNLEAKICDFGLSKLNSADNEHQSKVYTNAAGTNFYMDPLYHESGILRTDSDAYSFGVVMFELLSGLAAYNRRRIGDGELRTLINLVRRYYDYGKELLIDPEIKDKIDNSSFQHL